MHVAQGVHGVGFRFGIDVRHRHVVKQNLDFVTDSVCLQFKMVVGGDGPGGDVHQSGQHGDHDCDHWNDLLHE